MKLLDTSSISLFILEIPRFDCIALLYENGESLNTTYWVKEEFDQIQIAHLDKYIEDSIIFIKDVKSNLKSRYPFLGKGELSIIQWALNLKDTGESYFCVLDDKKARNVAERLNLQVKGSIGLIKILIDNNFFNENEINEIIAEIDNSNFNVSKDILQVLRE